MSLNGWRLILAAAFALLPSLPQASAEERQGEPSALIEVGGAGEWSSKGTPSFGPAVGIEVEPIEEWLEIEAGTAYLIHGRSTELETDLLFKKPFTLSDTVEFMAGVGPSWSHGVRGDDAGDRFGIEAAGDFMIWPWEGRKIGWYVEPSYGYSFARNHEQTFGLSAGMIIPIP